MKFRWSRAACGVLAVASLGAALSGCVALVGGSAVMAGMSQATFDTAWADDATARGILELRQQGERQYNIQATPTFVFGSRTVSGALPFDRFAQEVARG